jgi:transposase
VVRQELEREKGIRLTLRTVEREVRHLRRELEAEARATIRFETPPGKQLQIDFGERRVMIGDENLKVYLFVATLGYSRRLYIRPFRNERQESWFSGLEGAFRHFGGIAEEVLLDNDRGLVAHHDRLTREVEFNARLHAFAKHWGFRPRACAPYRARTKGKDERGVGYVKKNAMPVVVLRVGRHWRPTSTDGCARLPTIASMAPPVRRRSNVSGARRPVRVRSRSAAVRDGA